jgi:fructoselysine 6-phosphate deglycase
LLKGAGRTRPLDERAHSFINKYGKRITVLDAEEMGISQIAPEVVEFFNPLLLNIVLRSYAEHLATARNHPLSTRRYMWKVEY